MQNYGILFINQNNRFNCVLYGKTKKKRDQLNTFKETRLSTIYCDILTWSKFYLNWFQNRWYMYKYIVWYNLTIREEIYVVLPELTMKFQVLLVTTTHNPFCSHNKGGFLTVWHFQAILIQ